MKGVTFKDECKAEWPSVGMCVCERMCVCKRICVCKESFVFEKTREQQSRAREVAECRTLCLLRVSIVLYL